MAFPRINKTLAGFSTLPPGSVTKLCLIISLLSHVILLLAFQKPFLLQSSKEELRTYWVELIRPPVENGEAGEIGESEITRLEQNEGSLTEIDSNTISLDTEDKRFVTYTKLIKKKIGRHWSYPVEAKENLIEGKLIVIFSLMKNGNLTKIKVVKPSGHQILDAEAVRAIKNAAPFPAFPDHIRVSLLNIVANLHYRFGSGE